MNRVARHHLDMEDGGRVILGIAPGEGRVGKDGSAQPVLGVQVRAAHALVDDLLKRTVAGQPAVLAPADEHGDDAGVLADRTMPFRAHAAVGQDLRDRVPRGGGLFGPIRLTQCLDIIGRMIVADELKGVGHALDQVDVANDGSHDSGL
jgi:hypothetical protein